ncbi:hypothetical protein SAMN05216388_10578 [Halorientalis persicus]|uniref:Uncharacterized protein n=1 Tax=Halorientalis persicus TaxID=1367881 RepID=A0A1H8WFD7_9EURY|nr:hypothetical protein [Halorientalis persicus]SEP26223.1 hypothetical protein SAMN05216388_10578 [Halorientalis persicus]
MTASKITAVRALAVLVLVAFLGVLGWSLGQPGYNSTRLLLYAVLGGFAIIGAAGIVYERPFVGAGGACGLLLLGFWQAVLWLFIFPVAALLVVAAVLLANHENTSPSVAG